MLLEKEQLESAALAGAGGVEGGQLSSQRCGNQIAPDFHREGSSPESRQWWVMAAGAGSPPQHSCTDHEV